VNIFDRIVLLATGLEAIYLLFRFYEDYRRSESKATDDIHYMTSFAVLLVAGLLLIAFGFEGLESPLALIAGALIPLGISVGLVAEFFPAYEKGYLLFALVGVVSIAVTCPISAPGLATAVLIGAGGMALAFLKTGRQLLFFSSEVVFANRGAWSEGLGRPSPSRSDESPGGRHC
jgi:uncharacterized membrane protein HdeD (DUF308 family)